MIKNEGILLKSSYMEHELIISENEILLDIETTGFSPMVSTIFMIGCLYRKQDELHWIQWMCDSLLIQDERELLTEFFYWTQTHFHQNTFITYNGKMFDLPFIRTRCEQCNLPFPTEIFSYTKDLYQDLHHLKHLFPIKNMKLTTLAKWYTGNDKKDISGKKLINTFHAYIKTKDPVLLNLLYEHNRHDLENLYHILPLTLLKNFFNGAFDIQNVTNKANNLVIQMTSHKNLPFLFHHRKYDIEIFCEDPFVKLVVPFKEQGLPFYYQDYKKYVYLKSEDFVIHKSLAKFMPKDRYEKATPDNCYTWFQPDASFYTATSETYQYVRMIFELFHFL